MRADLDTVLNEIGATCLTGAEYALAASVMNGQTSNAAKYRALNTVLDKRGGCAAELQALHAHFAALLKGVDLNAVEKGIYKLDERSKQQAVLAYKREMNDLIVKGNTITSQTITAQDKSEQSKLKLENTQLKSFADIANVDHTLTEIKAMLSEFFGFVGPVINVIKFSVEGLSMIPQAITDTKDLFDMLIKRLPKWLGGRG